jgi:VCBS repeat-containing protein
MRVANTTASPISSHAPRPLRFRVALALAIALLLATTLGGALQAASIATLTVTLVPSGSVDEGAVATFEIRLSDAVTDGPVSVDVTTQDGTGGSSATAPSDYTARTETLVFAVGETVKHFEVVTIDDSTDELNESFSVVATLGTDPGDVPAAATIDGSPATSVAVIADNDNPNFVSITGPAGPVSEADDAEFTITLDAPSAQPVTFSYQVLAGAAPAATPGSDTDVSSGTWVVPASQASAVVVIPLTDDATPEQSENFVVRITGATNIANPGAVIGTEVAVTIADNDIPSLSVADASANEGAGPLSFVVTLSPASAGTVTVQYATSNGTAAAPGDYAAASGTLTFTPGQTSQNIEVSLVDDGLDEADETLTVSLSSPSAATITDGEATGTIVDNDGAPSLTVSPAEVTEGDGTSVTLSFTVALSAASGQTVTVNYATSDGTAAAPGDYTAASGTLTFTPGQTSQPVNVTVQGDTDYEGDETLTLTLSSPSNAALGTASATGTIRDNDLPTVQFDLPTSSGAEPSATVNVEVRLSAPVVAGQTVNVPYTVGAGSTATGGSDYTIAPSGSLSFAAGEQSKNIVVTVQDDALDEDAETVLLNLGTPSGATLAGQTSHTVTIDDDDAQPTVRFAAATSNTSESAGAASITVELSAASGRTVTVNYATSDGTATSPADYTAASGTLTFTPGQTSRTIPVTVVNDSVSETSETVGLTLSAPSNASLGASTHTLTIDDDDSPPQVLFDVTTSSFSESAGTATITVRLTQAAGADVSVNFAAAGGSAVSPADYTFATASPLTFAAGDTSEQITVNIAGNSTYQLDRTLVVELSGVSSTVPGVALGANTSHTLTIDDDDGPSATFATSAATIQEDGGSQSVTVTLSAAVLAGDTITLNLTPSGTAASPADYSAPSSVTFGPGESSKSFDITVVDNQVDAPDKTVVLTMSPATGSNVTLGANAQYTLTIADDDTTPVAQDDTGAVDEDATLTVAAPGVLGNDSDADGDAPTAELVSQPANGTLTLNADGSYSYAPAPDFNGTDSFTYRASDAGGNQSGVATVTITVNPVNDAPVAAADLLMTPEDAELALAAPGVLANDLDVDGDPLTAELLSEPSNGTLTLNGDGSLVYTPNPGFSGVDSFSYRVTDGTDFSEPATVTIRVGLAYTIGFPLVSGNPGRPDLVATFRLLPDLPSYSFEQQVLVTVTVTNTGTAPTGAGFWVDMYVNPASPPSGPNVRWDQICGIDPCRGIAWYVARSLSPGESVTLTSLKGNYVDEASRWDGRLPGGARSLYVFVDSWNPTVAYGAVQERDETNNRFGRTDFTVSGVASAPKSVPSLPPRPARP